MRVAGIVARGFGPRAAIIVRGMIPPPEELVGRTDTHASTPSRRRPEYDVSDIDAAREFLVVVRATLMTVNEDVLRQKITGTAKALVLEEPLSLTVRAKILIVEICRSVSNILITALKVTTRRNR